MKHAVLSLVFVATAAPALATDLVFGIGGTDYSEDGADDEVMGTLEIHGAPLYRFGEGFSLHPAGGFTVDGGGNYWIGAGLSMRGPLGGNGWFVEGSFMPGFYDADSRETDLGGHLEFRSLLGVGYEFDNGLRVSVAAEHKSNAGIHDDNPGMNAFSLRFGRGF